MKHVHLVFHPLSSAFGRPRFQENPNVPARPFARIGLLFTLLVHFMRSANLSILARLLRLRPSHSVRPNRPLQRTAPQFVVAFLSNSTAAGTAPGTRCAQNQRHTARQSRFLLAPFPVFSAAPSGAAAELLR